MKKPYLWGGLALAAVLALILAAGAAQQMIGPKPDGQDLYAYITKTSPYLQWSQWPGHEGLEPGTSPHGAFMKTYVNKPALEAVDKKMKVMPDGAILVKENYAEDKTTLVALTTMYKVKGYNPAAGDWFWAEYGPKGEMMASGKVQACIDCHGKAKAEDYLISLAK